MNAKKDNGEFKGRIAPALLASLAISLTVFVFGPFELYANNMAEFAFGLWDFFGILCAMAAALTAALMLVLIWLPSRVFDIACASVSLIALMTYVQGTFLTLGMTSIEGDGVGEGGISAIKVGINVAVWIVIIGAGVACAAIFSKKQSGAVRTAITFAMVVAIGMQAVSFITVAATSEGVFGKKDNRIESVEALTYNNLDKVANDKNVIYFVVDRFATSYYDTAMRECPEIFDSLEGFTYYNDAISLYPRTYPAITYMLTGVENDFSGTRSDYFKNAWESSEFLKTLHNEGYSINVYTDDFYAYEDSVPGGLPDYVSNSSGETEIVVSDRAGLVADMSRLSLYRYLPFALRRTVGSITSGDFIKHVELVSDETEAYSTDMKAAYEYFTANPLTVDGKKNFSFIHIQGVHLPNKYDRDFNPATDDNKSSSVEAMIQSFKIINLYIDQLKELGLYEDATIIITGDHASIGSDSKDPYYAHLTALMVKPGGVGEGEMKVSSAPVMQEDIHATVLDSEGIDATLDYGRSVLGMPEDEQRERRYYFQRYIKDDGTYEVVKYKIEGSAKTFSNWTVVERIKLDKSIYD